VARFARIRTTFATLGALLGALFGFVPFIPRLLRAVFTGAADRGRMLALMRAGLTEEPTDPPVPARGPVRVFLLAGEPSGDLHAADLAAALRLANPDVRLEGIGGPRMAAAGVELIEDLVSDPVMGIWPVVRRIPYFFALYRSLLVRFEEDPPDVFVGVDYPGLNMRLGRAARLRGVRTVEYIAPQVWAWAPWRCARLALAFHRIIAILPFEPVVFRKSGGEAVFVGHPLFEHLARRPADAEVVARLRDRLKRDAALVALMPGSRCAEVAANLPLLLGVARRVVSERPDTRFVVPLASERLRPSVEALLAASTDLEIELSPPENSDDAMAAADAAASVSGTATLHLLHHGTPAVICYRCFVRQRSRHR